jgi:hypothetical protein
MWRLSKLRRISFQIVLMSSVLVSLFLIAFLKRADLLLPFEMPDVKQEHIEAALPAVRPPHTIGQQFVANHPNLNSVELVVVVYDEHETGEPQPISFHLHRGDANGPLVAEDVLDSNDLEHNQLWRISFPPQRNSARQTYYFWLEGTSKNKASLWFSPVDVYQAGQRFEDHLPVDGDLLFSTNYLYDTAVFRLELDDVAREFGRSTILIILALLIPGWVLAAILSGKYGLDILEYMGLAFALSLALFAVMFLWATLLYGRLERSVLIVMYGLLFVGLLIWLGRRVYAGSWKFVFNRPSFEIVLGLIFFLIILGLRFVQVRELLVPPGIDAPHHALIAKLVSDSGSVPTTFLPLLPIESARYHFGFHTAVAAMTWLTGNSIEQTMLVLGQIISAVICLGVYFFAIQLTGHRKVALLSLILAGLVSPFPGYYLTWGRYSAILGLLLLVTTLGTTIMFIKRPDYRLLVAGALLWSGLFLTHYNMLTMAVLFLLVYVAYNAWLKRQTGSPAAPVSWWLAGLVGLSLFLGSPWIYHLIYSLGGDRIVMLASLPNNEGAPYFGLLAQPSFLWVLIPGIIGTFYGLWKQQDWVVLLWLWLLVAGSAANVGVWGVLRIFILNNSAFVLVVFLPIVILASYALLSAYYLLNQLAAAKLQNNQVGVGLQLLLSFVVIVFLIYSAWRQIPLLDRNEVSVTEEDLEAMKWIKENTADDAVFLTDAWYRPGQMTLGKDAGVWIPMLTGRQATLPPITFGQGSVAYKSEVTELVKAVQDAATANSIDDVNIRKTLESRGVTHVYLGARAGLLEPAMLRRSPYHDLVYSNGPVSIFEFHPSGSATLLREDVH